jgi:rhodanese-related sulfurtransferase
VQELTPREAAALLQAEPATTLLLDVREPVELERAAVPGALHIPMNEIPARLAELDPSKTIVCLCHGGGRSWHVAAFLEQQGFPAVINVIGGIHGWSIEVDPGIPTY